MSTVLRCCGNPSKFRVTYATDSVWLVCSTCIELLHWARNIKSKEDLDHA